MDYEPNINHIHAMIWVERESQKGIIVGEKGSKLKEIGTAARLDLERFFDKKVCLKLWVKVQDAWSDDVRMLQNIGIMEN
jgi:GTP-binding protein Era